jgi:hypothetical protein
MIMSTLGNENFCSVSKFSMAKGGLSLVPGRGARTFWVKIMRQLPFHGPSGPTIQIPHGKPAGRPFSPPHPEEAGQCLPEEGQPGRYFLPRSSLPPGHNRSFPELSNFNSHPGRAGGLQLTFAEKKTCAQNLCPKNGRKEKKEC